MLAYWREIDAFQTSVKLSEGKPEYVFFDGPPFATGLPHYGHLLAGTIKVRFGLVTLARQRGSHNDVTCRSGHRDEICARYRPSRSSSIWLGHPRSPRRARDR